MPSAADVREVERLLETVEVSSPLFALVESVPVRRPMKNPLAPMTAMAAMSVAGVSFMLSEDWAQFPMEKRRCHGKLSGKSAISRRKRGLGGLLRRVRG